MYHWATFILLHIAIHCGFDFLAIELEARKQQANFVQMSGGYMTAMLGGM